MFILVKPHHSSAKELIHLQSLQWDKLVAPVAWIAYNNTSKKSNVITHFVYKKQN